jgi:hypothetical protein
MKNYEVLIKERRSLGQLDHPEVSLVELSDVSHLITEIHWQGNEIYGTLELLNTPKGKIAQELISSGVKVGISSRAVGSLKESSEGSIVQDDCTWICWDLVSDSSCQGAYMTLKESFNPLDIKVISESGRQENLFSKEYRVNRILNKIICNCEDHCSI